MFPVGAENQDVKRGVLPVSSGSVPAGAWSRVQRTLGKSASEDGSRHECTYIRARRTYKNCRFRFSFLVEREHFFEGKVTYNITIAHEETSSSFRGLGLLHRLLLSSLWFFFLPLSLFCLVLSKRAFRSRCLVAV